MKVVNLRFNYCTKPSLNGVFTIHMLEWVNRLQYTHQTHMKSDKLLNKILHFIWDLRKPGPLSHWTTYWSVCVCACVCMCACVCACVRATQPRSDGSCRSLCGAGKYTGWARSKLSPDDPHWSHHFSQPPSPTEPETQGNKTSLNKQQKEDISVIIYSS